MCGRRGGSCKPHMRGHRHLQGNKVRGRIVKEKESRPRCGQRAEELRRHAWPRLPAGWASEPPGPSAFVFVRQVPISWELRVRPLKAWRMLLQGAWAPGPSSRAHGRGPRSSIAWRVSVSLRSGLEPCLPLLRFPSGNEDGRSQKPLPPSPPGPLVALLPSVPEVVQAGDGAAILGKSQTHPPPGLPTEREHLSLRASGGQSIRGVGRPSLLSGVFSVLCGTGRDPGLLE